MAITEVEAVAERGPQRTMASRSLRDDREHRTAGKLNAAELQYIYN